MEARSGVQKNFLETISGMVFDNAFEQSTYKSRHVRVTNFVFLTVRVIERDPGESG